MVIAYRLLSWPVRLKVIFLCNQNEVNIYLSRNTRICDNETTINGFTIPKGITVHIPTFALAHDPDYWDEPYQFKPERWAIKITFLSMHSTVITLGRCCPTHAKSSHVNHHQLFYSKVHVPRVWHNRQAKPICSFTPTSILRFVHHAKSSLMPNVSSLY